MSAESDNGLIGLKNYCVRYFDKQGSIIEVLEEEDFNEEQFTKYGKRNKYDSMVIEKNEIIVDKKL